MKDGPNSAKAVGGFNLTAQPLGFLQPLFAGSHGDNQTYIQHLDDPAKISSFDAVAWPERDTILFDNPTFGTVNEESLWSFAFPNERPLILPWTRFRELLRDRIGSSVFANHPLLQFDLVQTLDLVESKPVIFDRAFHAYARAGDDVAARWRDRAILEPALVDALRAQRNFSINPLPSLRARIDGNVARIELSHFDPSTVDFLENAYRDISERHEAIFPKVQRVEVLPRPNRQSLPTGESKGVTVILVGKLVSGEIDNSNSGREIDVINADHLQNHLRRKRPSQLFIVLGRQSDWQQLVDIGESIKLLPSLVVVLSAATEPLASDIDIQRELQIPSVLMFALTREFNRKMPMLRAIMPLLDILSLDKLPSRTFFDVKRMPARHCLLLREEIRFDRDADELGCRLGARAIRGGVRVGARIDLFVEEGKAAFAKETIKAATGDWERIFEPLFATSYPGGTILPQDGAQSYLTLLADRSFSESTSQSGSTREGIVRLLRMRGWHVEPNERNLDISTENRKFSAVIVERREHMPVEELALQRPSFGRSHLLIIHVSPSRETLLIGNRGQYNHITIEDISLMRPNSQWMWPILRRQLDSRSVKTSLAALRLAASLAAEAIHTNRIKHSSNQREELLDQLVSLLQADDCERFVSFISKKTGPVHIEEKWPRKKLHLRVRARGLSENIPVDPELTLSVEDEGPTVVLDW